MDPPIVLPDMDPSVTVYENLVQLVVRDIAELVFVTVPLPPDPKFCSMTETKFELVPLEIFAQNDRVTCWLARVLTSSIR